MHPAGSAIRWQRRWALALLPALLLRALIPASFMPAVGAGSIALVFCESGVFAPAGHHGHHDGAGHSGDSVSGGCPFAQSAAPVLPPIAALPPAPPLIAHVEALRPEHSALRSVRPRHAAPRGPPALS